MTHDTTKDPRIIVAHLACGLLMKGTKQKPGVSLKLAKDKLAELVSACESAVMILMYLYQEPGALVSSEPMSKLQELAATLADAYEPLVRHKGDQSMLRANVRWCLRTLEGLADRLGNSGDALSSGVDLATVQVRNVERRGGFLNTKVTDGITDYTVVTNMMEVESDSLLAAAFLPPREIGNTVSEAMYLGNEKRTEAPGTLLDGGQVNAKDADAILYEELQKHPK